MSDAGALPSIGGVTLRSPFILAPMAGYTDAAYRQLCGEQGAALVFTEMVSAKGLFYDDRHTQRLPDMRGKNCPVGIQIFGADPFYMERAAEKLQTLPNELVDINMGCPVPKIVKNGEGSALLRDPEKVYAVVRAVVRGAGKPVTVKLRTHIDGAPQDACLLAAEAAEAAGASAVTVHGRTREQYYNGHADWEIIASVNKKLSIPVIGNGDIRDAASALRARQVSGVSLLMIGRAALGDPWIFRRLTDGLAAQAEPVESEEEVKQKIGRMMLKQFHLMISYKGETQAVREMRKHVPKYLKGMYAAAHLRAALNGAPDRDTFCRLIEENLLSCAGTRMK